MYPALFSSALSGRPFKYAPKGLLFLMLVISSALNGQDFRQTSFSFLLTPANARIAGLGGVNVSLADKDPNAFFSNPVLTGDTLEGFVSTGYQFYVGDIGQACFSWSPRITRAGMVSFGVRHISYGTISSYDAAGNELGDVTAGESAVYISKQHQAGNFRFGATAKFVTSNITGYRANAVIFDLGGLFLHPEKELTVGLVIKNTGFLINDYTDGSGSSMPFDIQAGTTFKPEFMPIRFSFSAYRLTDYSAVTYSGNRQAGTRMLDKVFRHFNFGAEVLIHRNANLLVGYNYGIHQELKLENAGGSAGLSFGVAAHIRSVDFVFSRNTYVAGSAAYNFTLGADLNRMLKR